MVETVLTLTVIATIIWLWDYNKKIGFQNLWHDPRIGKSTFSKPDAEEDDDDR